MPFALRGFVFRRGSLVVRLCAPDDPTVEGRARYRQSVISAQFTYRFLPTSQKVHNKSPGKTSFTPAGVKTDRNPQAREGAPTRKPATSTPSPFSHSGGEKKGNTTSHLRKKMSITVEYLDINQNYCEYFPWYTDSHSVTMPFP